MKLETTKHSLRLSHLSVMQQQRALRNLARACRMRNKEKLLNGESQEANTYDWHRNVRLKREARAIHLFRAYLKGTPYKSVERNLKSSTMKAWRIVSFTPTCFTKGGFWGDEEQRFWDWLEAE